MLSDYKPGSLPKGTVTFLFTDIEGSTELLRKLGEEYVTLLADHHQILRTSISKWNGREVGIEGDAFFISFPRASDAVNVAVEVQRALADHTWPQEVSVRVRMGLHTGEPWTVQEDYAGMDVHRAARIAHAGHGGQVLLSESTVSLVRNNLPSGIQLIDLGSYRLKDIQFPELIFQLVIDELQSEFPPLKAIQLAKPFDKTLHEAASLPGFLGDKVPSSRTGAFVGREDELAWLDKHLNQALHNQGHCVFVSGQAGMGKTSLLQAFARYALNQVPSLLTAWGSCNSFIGSGDAYQPFRQVMGILSGCIEQSWQSRTITTEQAKRLWEALPLTGRILAEKGQALVGTLVDGRMLLSQIRLATNHVDEWQYRLERLADWIESNPADLNQDQLHHQCTTVVRAISAKHPLLIILDDLQWADGASLNLLFHFGQSLADSQILILGAYRPEEVLPDRQGDRHPLEKVVNELRRLGGEVVLDLDKTTPDEKRIFVNDLLDSEPNEFSQPFRDALLSHTQGLPLFTVEILRYLQETGKLIKDTDGKWRETDQIGWKTLPYRVEGVIKERIGRLNDDLRELLTVAATEGETFTAQVVARVQNMDLRNTLRSFSRELDKRHRLVSEQIPVTSARQPLARFCFNHSLYQQYLYADLSNAERQLLHAEIAAALEELYAGETEHIAIQLGRHYIEARDEMKALPYLVQAGDQARDRYADEEAIAHYQQAKGLFSRIAASTEQQIEIFEQLSQVLLNVGRYQESRDSIDAAIALTTDPWILVRLYLRLDDSYSMQHDYERAHWSLNKAESVLSQAPQSPPEPWWQAWLDIQLDRFGNYYWTNQIADMARLSEELDPLVERYGSPSQIASYHGLMGNLYMRMERYVLSDKALACVKRACEAALSSENIALIAARHFGLGFSYLWYGWYGDLDKAEEHLRAALDIAEEIGRVVLKTRSLTYLTVLYRRRREREEVARLLPQVMELAQQADTQEYVGIAEANIAWLKWLDVDYTDSKDHGLNALAMWEKLPLVMPFQWTALWPLVGVALAQNDLEEVVSYAERLLQPEMSRLPDQLTDTLHKAIAAWSSHDWDIARARLQSALHQARQLNHL